jgi:Tfp pilus assembly protein PilN
MILFYFLNYSLTMLSLNSEIDYFDSIINNSVYQEKYRSVQILKDKTNTLNSYKDLLTSLNANLSKTDIVKTELLNSLASSMPVDTSLASLSINGPNVAIQGKSVLRESVAQLVKNLSDLESIASVHAPTISRIESEDGSSYDFTINIVLKEVQ